MGRNVLSIYVTNGCVLPWCLHKYILNYPVKSHKNFYYTFLAQKIFFLTQNLILEKRGKSHAGLIKITCTHVSFHPDFCHLKEEYLSKFKFSIILKMKVFFFTTEHLLLRTSHFWRTNFRIKGPWVSFDFCCSAPSLCLIKVPGLHLYNKNYLLTEKQSLKSPWLLTLKLELV